MPRYQPPIITGGTRDAPTWSELASYYLPDQPFMPQQVGPSPFQSRQEYANRPVVVNAPPLPNFQGVPSPPTQGEGGTAYDEIMNRLRRRPTPVREQEEGALPAAEAETVGPGFADLSEYGLPEGWQNGDPGHGAARAAVLMRPDQVAARREASLVDDVMSELGFGEGTGTGQITNLPENQPGQQGAVGLGTAMSGQGPYDPYNPLTGVSVAPGAAAADTTTGWSVASAGRGVGHNRGVWEGIVNAAAAAGNFLQFAAQMQGTFTPTQVREVWEAYQAAERKRRLGRDGANAEAAAVREVNNNE